MWQDKSEIQKFDAMMSMDGQTLEFEVRRTEIDEGRSFSEEAMTALVDDVTRWIGTRLMRRWDQAGEPPTVMSVIVTVNCG